MKKMILNIETGENNPKLRAICKKVEIFDTKLEKTIQDMEDTMLGEQEGGVTGIGLAASQVGILKQILLMTLNVGSRKNAKVLVMVNPKILEVSEQTSKMEEGCLSLPGVSGKVDRPRKVKVQWQNAKGNLCEKKLEGWDARIFFHEFDHLQGKLFIDYL